MVTDLWFLEIEIEIEIEIERIEKMGCEEIENLKWVLDLEEF